MVGCHQSLVPADHLLGEARETAASKETVIDALAWMRDARGCSGNQTLVASGVCWPIPNGRLLVLPGHSTGYGVAGVFYPSQGQGFRPVTAAQAPAFLWIPETCDKR